MRTKVAYTVSTSGFAEYVYYSMRRANPNDLSALDFEDMKPFKSSHAMMKFALKETMERRLDLLMKLGKTFTVMIYADPIDMKYLSQGFGTPIEYEYMAESMLDLLRKGDHFVFGSRQMVQLTEMAAAFASGSNYILDLDFHKISEITNPARYDRTDIDEADAEQAYTELANLVTHATSALLNADSFSGLSILQMRVLLIHYAHKHRYVLPETVIGMIGGLDSSAGITRSATMLVKQGLLVRMMPEKGGTTENAAMITDKGIKLSMQFLKLIKTRTFRG